MSNTKTGSTLSHSKIFDYWKDKCIDKYGNVFDNIPENFDNTIEVVSDWGEPQCWCCGKIIPVEQDKHYDEWIESGEEKDLFKIWNSRITKHYLNRAHIKPRMLGGKDEPQNLFLICEKCHIDSPDLSNPKMFLAYIYNCRTNKESMIWPEFNTLKKANEILKDIYNISLPIFDNADTLINYGQHGGGISENTRIYKLIAAALNNKTQLRSDLEDMFRKYINSKISEIEASIDACSNNEEKNLLSTRLEVYKEILTSYETFKTIENSEVND